MEQKLGAHSAEHIAACEDQNIIFFYQYQAPLPTHVESQTNIGRSFNTSFNITDPQQCNS